MARVDSIQKPTTLLTLKKSKSVANETAGTLAGEIMLITDDLGTVQGDIRISSGRYYHTLPFVQVGSIIYYAGEHVPDGYLICDGSLVSQRLYPELFDKIQNFWWKRPFKHDNQQDATEVYYVGSGGTRPTGSLETWFWSNWKIKFLQEDHPSGPQFNTYGKIFQERDDQFEPYYQKIQYPSWTRSWISSEISSQGNFLFNGGTNFNAEFNAAYGRLPDPAIDIVRDPVFALPNFTSLYTAEATEREKLQGYFVRNLNENYTESHPDYYKTEYDERGLWNWSYHDGSNYRSSGPVEFHKIMRSYSSLQENEVRRHRHRLEDVGEGPGRSGKSGAHAHDYHGSVNSTNGDPLGRAVAGVAGREDQFGRRATTVETFDSGWHNHFGYVGFGHSVDHEEHETYVVNKKDETLNSIETRPWSYSVQFCIKY